MIYPCCAEPGRVAATRASPYNGIEFLEVIDRAGAAPLLRQRVLKIHLLKARGALALSPANVRIEGGQRIRGITVQAVDAPPGPDGKVFTVQVDQPGDFSPYTLRLVGNAGDPGPPSGIDPRLAAVSFWFKVDCPSPFDCQTPAASPPPLAAGPDIDYLARDFSSFRRLMLDRIATLSPSWKERNVADLGVTLVEALAYLADQLSYQQDAIATEAYLGTARQRVSLRRHARLMDYRIGEGCNARAWVQLEVSADAVGAAGEPLIARGTKLLTRVAGEKTCIADDPQIYRRAAVGFETMEPLDALHLDLNELQFYTWSDQQCWLPSGATAATLAAHHPALKQGTVLLFEEVKGRTSGSTADADPSRRHVVRLSAEPVFTVDPVSATNITEIRWHEADGLPFALCLSARISTGAHETIAVARGNLLLADHGLQVHDETLGTVPASVLTRRPAPSAAVVEPIPARYRPRLAQGPLTHAAPYAANARALPARAALAWNAREAVAAVTLTAASGSIWKVQQDLLASGPADEAFVAEIDNDGVAWLRFGDGRRGKRPATATAFAASYRIGNGSAGNVGADSLTHIVASIAEVVRVRNPLPASGGQDPESLDDVRQRAPAAYRIQERAVTAADYAEVTERHTEVQKAAAQLRWTGSWHTVFVTVDRGDAASVSAPFEQALREHIGRYRMAGHDLEIDGPRFVALRVDLRICVAPSHFRSDVQREVVDVLSNRLLPDGRRGLFHPDNFTFGQPVYLSALYAAAHRVAGVISVAVRTFERLSEPANDGLDSGRLEMAQLEIAQLDNDPNYPERGVLTISLGGGR